MPEQWYAVINSTTGEARSFGTVLADRLSAGTEAVEIDHQPGEGERWDAATRAVVAIADSRPNVGGFLESVVGMLGVKRARSLDRDYGTWDALMAGTAVGFKLAAAGIAEMVGEGDLTQQEHDDVMGLWVQFNLPVPQ